MWWWDIRYILTFCFLSPPEAFIGSLPFPGLRMWACNIIEDYKMNLWIRYFKGIVLQDFLPSPQAQHIFSSSVCFHSYSALFEASVFQLFVAVRNLSLLIYWELLGKVWPAVGNWDHTYLLPLPLRILKIVRR